jgi:hypothetical protein
MKIDLKADFDRLFELVTRREKEKYEFRLERQALRIKRSLLRLKETPTDPGVPSRSKSNFYGVVGEYSLLK